MEPTGGGSISIDCIKQGFAKDVNTKMVQLKIIDNGNVSVTIAHMKKIMFGLVLVSIITLSYAPSASAQTASRETLLQQIQSLLALIKSLQEQLALKNGAQTTPGTFNVPRADETSTEKAPGLSSFPTAKNPWSTRFTPTSVPKNSYQAYYINTRQPNTIVFKAVVPQVAISYAWDDGGTFKIASEDFGGYWVGNIDIAADGNYEVSTAESWSESRVIINGREIKTQTEESVPVYLKKGTYKVGVEFVNNWHTTDFAMNILPQNTQYSGAELKEKLSPYKNAKNWYVGVYETENSNRRLSLDTSRMSEDSILFLNSYSQLNWVLTANKFVKAVVVSSYEPGTIVSGVPTGVPVFYATYDTIASEYSLDENCDSYRGSVFSLCDYIDQLSKIDNSLFVLTGRKMDTFTGAYSPTILTAPGKVISDTVRKSILRSYSDAKAEAISESESQSISNIY